jgi:hypothetical protein
LKLDKEEEHEGEGSHIIICSIFYLASHAVEHNQQGNWERKSDIKAKETNTRKKNSHEVAEMQIDEGNVISQSI